MRYRTIGLAAAVLLAAPLMTSCRNPRPPGGGTTTTMPSGGSGIPGPTGGQQNCGIINKADPVTAAETQSANCFLQYHTVVVGVYLQIRDGSNVTVAQASGHTVTVTRLTIDNAGQATVVKHTVCSPTPNVNNSQFSVDGAGNLRGILGNTCQF
jgi:hypothetical protein